MSTTSFQPGDRVRLDSAPDGYTSRHYALTVGQVYTVVDLEGSCLWTTSDIEGENARCWHGRFTKV